MATLDELNARVTSAILHAERLAPDSFEALSAFREVSRLEESIARLTSPGEIEGEIARVGAITAALSASDPLLALELIDRYRQDDVSKEVLQKLEGLEAEAEVDLARASSCSPTVYPVRFTLAAA
jgi:hypothetical protein